MCNVKLSDKIVNIYFPIWLCIHMTKSLLSTAVNSLVSQIHAGMCSMCVEGCWTQFFLTQLLTIVFHFYCRCWPDKVWTFWKVWAMFLHILSFILLLFKIFVWFLFFAATERTKFSKVRQFWSTLESTGEW